MKKYLGLSVIMLIYLLFPNCYSISSEGESDSAMIKGRWQSTSDSNWELEFEKDTYISYYKNDSPPDTFEYKFSEACSCCESNGYITEGADIDAIFMNTYSQAYDDSMCYEITGLNEEVFAIRETGTGSFSSFKRVD